MHHIPKLDGLFQWQITWQLREMQNVSVSLCGEVIRGVHPKPLANFFAVGSDCTFFPSIVDCAT